MRLSRLTLEEIHLEDGEFYRIFQLLTSMQGLECLHLDNLYESRMKFPLNFEVLGQPRLHFLAHAIGPNMLTRTGATDVRQPIRYRCSPRMIVGDKA